MGVKQRKHTCKWGEHANYTQAGRESTWIDGQLCGNCLDLKELSMGAFYGQLILWEKKAKKKGPLNAF